MQNDNLSMLEHDTRVITAYTEGTRCEPTQRELDVNHAALKSVFFVAPWFYTHRLDMSSLDRRKACWTQKRMTRISQVDLEAPRACLSLNFAIVFCLFASACPSQGKWTDRCAQVYRHDTSLAQEYVGFVKRTLIFTDSQNTDVRRHIEHLLVQRFSHLGQVAYQKCGR